MKVGKEIKYLQRIILAKEPTNEHESSKPSKVPTKTSLLSWVGMLLFPIFVGGIYFLFFSDFFKIMSFSTDPKNSNSAKVDNVSSKVPGSVIKGEITSPSPEVSSGKEVEKKGEIWPDKARGIAEKQAEVKKQGTKKTGDTKVRKQSPQKKINIKKSKVKKRSDKTPHVSAQKSIVSKSTAHKKFSVRIGIYRLNENANAVVNDAREKGYEAFVTVVSRKVREKRIYIKSFKNISEVSKVRKLFSKKDLETYPEPLGKDMYTVYIGPFPARKNTKKIENMVKNLGYQPRTSIRKITRKLSYVWVGKFAKKEDAEAVLPKLKKEFSDCLVSIF